MRRRKDPWDQPWVAIAAVGGIIVVVIIALVFFMGGGSTGGQAAPSGQISPAQVTTHATTGASGPSASSVTASVTGINAAAIKEVTIATIPVTGVYVHVNYIGSFSGTYGINGEKLALRDSGDRVFPLNATAGTVTASFHKDDRSTRHEIVVEIYKNGKAIKFGKNASAYGDVSISSTV